MTEYTQDILIAAHKHSSIHKEEVLNSEVCGCFYCLKTFFPNEVIEWVDEDNPISSTALCVICNIDAVIGSASGYPVADKTFLEAMRQYWFIGL